MTVPLILTVTPRGKPGIYTAKIDGTVLAIRATKHPLLDAAKSLLFVGVNPQAVLIMRNQGSAVDRISGQIGAIVRTSARKGRITVGNPSEPARRPTARHTGGTGT